MLSVILFDVFFLFLCLALSLCVFNMRLFFINVAQILHYMVTHAHYTHNQVVSISTMFALHLLYTHTHKHTLIPNHLTLRFSVHILCIVCAKPVLLPLIFSPICAVTVCYPVLISYLTLSMCCCCCF